MFMPTVDAPLGFVLGSTAGSWRLPLSEPLKPLTVPLFGRLRGPKTFSERAPHCLEPGDSNARYLNRAPQHRGTIPGDGASRPRARVAHSQSFGAASDGKHSGAPDDGATRALATQLMHMVHANVSGEPV